METYWSQDAKYIALNKIPPATVLFKVNKGNTDYGTKYNEPSVNPFMPLTFSHIIPESI